MDYRILIMNDVFSFIDDNDHDLRYVYNTTLDTCDDNVDKFTNCTPRNYFEEMVLDPVEIDTSQPNEFWPEHDWFDSEEDDSEDEFRNVAKKWHLSKDDAVKLTHSVNGVNSGGIDKLGRSRSPVLDAFVYCSLTNQGVILLEENKNVIRFNLYNFPMYHRESCKILHKHAPTQLISARIKALNVWFGGYIMEKELKMGYPCLIELRSGSIYKSVRTKFDKIRDSIARQRKLLGM